MATEDKIFTIFQEIQGLERERCALICDEVAKRYPVDIFPRNGKSLDCLGAKMARLTCANIKRLIIGRNGQG